jgi:hypothetical protein
MSNSIFERESTFQFPSWRAVGRDACDQRERDALTAELQASFAREEALREEKRDLSQRQVILAQEFEHRLINGLQWIASLLSLQSRAATTPEPASQLTIAARRIVAPMGLLMALAGRQDEAKDNLVASWDTAEPAKNDRLRV